MKYIEVTECNVTKNEGDETASGNMITFKTKLYDGENEKDYIGEIAYNEDLDVDYRLIEVLAHGASALARADLLEDGHDILAQVIENEMYRTMRRALL